MSFFNKKKNKETSTPAKEAKKVAVKEVKNVEVAPTASAKSSHAIVRDHVIIGPRITEKGSRIAEKNVYTLNVLTSANAKTVKEDVAKIYKVHPIRVQLINIPRKATFNRGKKGMKNAGKKAYVTLKEGDRIEFV